MPALNRTGINVLTVLVLACGLTPSAQAQRSGSFSLVPIGVVGGDPPGTVINGNEITIPSGGVFVEFEVRATWGGESGLRLAGAQ